MVKKHVAVFCVVVFVAKLSTTLLAQDAKIVLNAATQAMGAENLKTLQYSGAGSNAGIGQNRCPIGPSPMFNSPCSILIRTEGGSWP